MSQRIRQILIVSAALWGSWLGMMLVHELGHVLGAKASGGAVRRVVWHPAALSRTDVLPNPHPLIEVWAGPLFGCALPLLVAGLARAACLRTGYLYLSFAGFCLIANGGYIGIGAGWPVGDADELIRHGTPRGFLVAFGIVALVGGFWIWHRVSPRLGFGKAPAPIEMADVWLALVAATVLTLGSLALGYRDV